jgi:hypothetical protein
MLDLLGFLVFGWKTWVSISLIIGMLVFFVPGAAWIGTSHGKLVSFYFTVDV